MNIIPHIYVVLLCFYFDFVFFTTLDMYLFCSIEPKWNIFSIPTITLSLYECLNEIIDASKFFSVINLCNL